METIENAKKTAPEERRLSDIELVMAAAASLLMAYLFLVRLSGIAWLHFIHPDWTIYDGSKLYLAFVFLFTGFQLWLKRNKGLNAGGLLLVAFFPTAMVVAIVFCLVYIGVLIAVLIAAGIAIILEFVPWLAACIKRKRMLRKKRYKFINGLALGIAIFFIVPLPLSSYTHLSFYLDPALAQDGNKEKGKAIDEGEYLEMLQGLDERIWGNMNAPEKLNVLRKVVEYECTAVLGCPIPTITEEVLDEENGVFRYPRDLIGINAHVLENNKFQSVLATTLHEIRHHYQYVCIDMYYALEKEYPEYASLQLFDEVAVFKTNAMKYKPTKNLLLYLAQPMEIDARQYSESRMEEFYLANLDFGESSRSQ